MLGHLPGLVNLATQLLFCGYQMSALRLRPVVSSLAFTVLHLTSGGGQQSAVERVLFLAVPFGFAFAGGALMIRTDSLWASVGVHGGFHLGVVAGVFLGLGGGPILWVACGAGWALIGLALLAVARRRGPLDRVWTGPTR